MLSAFANYTGPGPKIVTDRLTLRPFERRELTERYVAWLNDPESVRYSEQRHHKHTLATCEAYYLSMQRSGNWFLAILHNDGTPVHVGNLSIVFDAPNATADMAILIGESAARGHGLGREAWQAVMEHLLMVKGIRKVTAGTMSSNAPMMAVACQCGMGEEGRRRRQFLFEDRTVDMVLFAKFHDEDALDSDRDGDE